MVGCSRHKVKDCSWCKLIIHILVNNQFVRSSMVFGSEIQLKRIDVVGRYWS